MKLHLDQAAFTVLLDSIHAKTGYRTDVLEKDYYVTLMLEELAAKQRDGLKAYFKGCQVPVAPVWQRPKRSGDGRPCIKL